MKNFRQFVAEQVARGESLPPVTGYLYSESAQIEICNWLESRSGENWQAVKQSTLQWLQDSMGARRVKTVMDEIMEGDLAPTMTSIRATWDRTQGTRSAPTNYNCADCYGTGFKIVFTASGAEGAKRCPRECPVPAARQDRKSERQVPDEEAHQRWVSEVGAELAAKIAKPVNAL